MLLLTHGFFRFLFPNKKKKTAEDNCRIVPQTRSRPNLNVFVLTRSRSLALNSSLLEVHPSLNSLDDQLSGLKENTKNGNKAAEIRKRNLTREAAVTLCREKVSVCVCVGRGLDLEMTECER